MTIYYIKILASAHVCVTPDSYLPLFQISTILTRLSNRHTHKLFYNSGSVTHIYNHIFGIGFYLVTQGVSYTLLIVIWIFKCREFKILKLSADSTRMFCNFMASIHWSLVDIHLLGYGGTETRHAILKCLKLTRKKEKLYILQLYYMYSISTIESMRY